MSGITRTVFIMLACFDTLLAIVYPKLLKMIKNIYLVFLMNGNCTAHKCINNKDLSSN